MKKGHELVIHRYEEYILGKSSFSIQSLEYKSDGIETFDDSNASMNLRKKEVAKTKEKEALALVRYIISDLLGWDPQEAMESLTDEVVRQTKLDMISTYVHFPSDLSSDKDYDWLIHRAFPDETKYDVSDRVLQMYQRVLNGEFRRFPKRFFDGDDATEKLTVLLKDYISKNLPAGSVEDLYEAFGSSARGNLLMHDAKLFYAYQEIYATPLDYLHGSLGESKDDFLYDYYRFMSTIENIEREEFKNLKKEKERKKENEQL